MPAFTRLHPPLPWPPGSTPSHHGRPLLPADGYPWYTDVRETLEDPAYSDWYISFKPEGLWSNPKCDSANKSLCSNHFHNQEQSPGYPHGDGDCLAPQCDCGSVPCGFYVFNHSTTTTVKGQTFQDWFINDCESPASQPASSTPPAPALTPS